MTLLVELGGGTKPHPRADVVIDLHHPENSPPQDAAVTPWRVGSGETELMIAPEAVHEVYSSHFLEHIPKGQPLVDVMNEAHRVLRPGGIFTAILPVVGVGDRWVGRPEPWADPTHVSHWWLPNALTYFSATHAAADADYGIAGWEMGGRISEAEATRILDAERDATAAHRSAWWSVRDGWEGVFRLVKPAEVSD